MQYIDDTFSPPSRLLLSLQSLLSCLDIKHMMVFFSFLKREGRFCNKTLEKCNTFPVKYDILEDVFPNDLHRGNSRWLATPKRWRFVRGYDKPRQACQRSFAGGISSWRGDCSEFTSISPKYSYAFCRMYFLFPKNIWTTQLGLWDPFLLWPKFMAYKWAVILAAY